MKPHFRTGDKVRLRTLTKKGERPQHNLPSRATIQAVYWTPEGEQLLLSANNRTWDYIPSRFYTPVRKDQS